MKTLAVYYNDTRAGLLAEHNPGRAYSFQYDRAYLDADLPAISATLPTREDAYSADSLFPFFCNLLPEGANRRVICRSLKIDEKDDFSLLSALAGMDFIGAVNIRKIGDE